MLIFDESNSHYLTDYILKDIPSSIYQIRSIKFYVSGTIIYNFIKSLFSFELFKINKFNIRFFLKELLCHYHLSCIKYINPKVIITLADNSSYYHWLCRKYKNAKFFAIQNGNRTNEQLKNKSKHFHEHYFCFGNYDVGRYKKFGHHIQYAHPVGSLLAGYYKHSLKKEDKVSFKYDISIVSQVNNDLLKNRESGNSAFKKSIYLMHEFCSKYIYENKISAQILMRRSKTCNDEISFYKNFYDENVVYKFNNMEDFSTYKGMDESKVVIGFFSTSSIEAFGWGSKILHCDFTSGDKYNDYSDDIMFRKPSYEYFRDRLDSLLNEDYLNYKNRSKNYSSFLMNNNSDLPPHIYIRNKLKNILYIK